jgi:hypothetical protein
MKKGVQRYKISIYKEKKTIQSLLITGNYFLLNESGKVNSEN